jgi:hypothetical protein
VDLLDPLQYAGEVLRRVAPGKYVFLLDNFLLLFLMIARELIESMQMEGLSTIMIGVWYARAKRDLLE